RPEIRRRQACRLDSQPLPDGQGDIPRLRTGQCLLDVFRRSERLAWIEASQYSPCWRTTDRMRLGLEVAEEAPQRSEELRDGRVAQAPPGLAAPLEIPSARGTDEDVIGF